MESTKPLRKSCDFCYRRRIKCDGEKPLCSNCIAYGTDCTYTAPSRNSAPKKRRRSPSLASDDGGIDTHSRLTRLESMFEHVNDRLDVVERRATDDSSLAFEESNQSATVTTTTTRTRSDSSAFRSIYLPPQEQVMSVIHTYLQDFNAVLPLFNASILLRTVRTCYESGPSKRDPVAWAAIYVVLGLATQHGLVTSHEIPSAVSCLARAESVLSDVVLGDVQLLNIQVLVGLVLLLQASQDLKPALVLIGTTLRLAHTIGLHDRAHSEHLDSLHSKQRACVFWLAYILDKNLSMRARQPSVQVDDDIDLEVPSQTVLQCPEGTHETEDNNDASGVIATTDGYISINYFFARIHLATIEGGVYDYIHSTRARRRNPEERSQAVQSLASALEKWKISIPHEFSVAASPRNVPSRTVRFLGIMHAASLACATQINQAWAWDNDWMTAVRMYGRQGIQPILPPAWEALVGEARDLLILSEAVGEIGTSNFWTIGCTYMTAMVLLTVESMQNPRHDDLSLDVHLLEGGLRKIHQMVEDTKSEALQSFQEIFTELRQHAHRNFSETVRL